MVTTKRLGEEAEARALAHLQRGGEIDLILRDRDGTLVFVEVRRRSATTHGGAAASIVAAKRRSLLLAAQHYLLRLASPPPCRFDVVAIDGDALEWLQAAFDAGA
jgi:putative endonuclease